MSRQIQIVPKTTNLTRGKPMPVAIRVHFDKPTKIRGIQAHFHGAERTEADYTTTSTDSKGRTQTHHHTAVQYVDIAKRNFVLHGDPADGFFESVGDALATMFGGGVSETIAAGDHEFGIEIEVPENAPASFEGKKCSVFYRLQVQVDVPLRPDPKHDYEFAVLTVEQPIEKTKSVLASYPDPEKGRGFWDSTFGKDVKVDVALDRDVVIVGEEVRGMVSIKTNERLKLDQIKLNMIGIEYSLADGHNDSHHYVVPVGTISTPAIITNELNEEFTFQPPPNYPGSVSGTNFRIEWKLQVRLDVPWAKDTSIGVPVKFYSV